MTDASPRLKVLFFSPDSRAELDAVFHDMSYIDANGDPLPGSHLQDCAFLERAKGHLLNQGGGLYVCGDRFYTFMAINYAAMHTDTVVLRRSAMEMHQLPFPEDVSIGEDTELWYQVARRLKMAYLERKLSRYREHSAGIARNKDRLYEDLYFIHARNYHLNGPTFTSEERAAYRKRISSHCFSKAYHHWTQGRRAPLEKLTSAHSNGGPMSRAFLRSPRLLCPTALRVWLRHCGRQPNS